MNFRSRSFERIQSLNMHETLDVLTDIRGLSLNVDSVHRFLQSPSLLMCFRQKQISPSSDTNHLQFPNDVLHFYFVSKAVPTSIYIPDFHDLIFTIEMFNFYG